MHNGKGNSNSGSCSPANNIDANLRDLQALIAHAREIEEDIKALALSLREPAGNAGVYSDMGISSKKMSVAGKQLCIYYIAELTDREMLSQFVIKPILDYNQAAPLDIDILHQSVINLDEVAIDSKEEKLLDYVLKGYSVITIDNNKEKYIFANTLKVEKRTTQPPEMEQTLLGARDSFTENLNSNISLIRYRIKDPSLRIYKCLIGKRTKTNVAVVIYKRYRKSGVC